MWTQPERKYHKAFRYDLGEVGILVDLIRT